MENLTFRHVFVNFFKNHFDNQFLRQVGESVWILRGVSNAGLPTWICNSSAGIWNHSRYVVME